MTQEHAESAPWATQAAIDQLSASLGGSLAWAGDSEYEAARHIYNGMIERRPALIARCASTGDVIKVVRFAREHTVEISVKAGGHNVAGNALCDGGLTIDLSLMRGVRVDPVARTARVDGGATWRDFDRECQVFDLASTGGLISSTGVAGLTLGGGFGWLGRSYGMACDNLLSAGVVLADGSYVTASEHENAELFWGLRGGGGNFGIVTSFEFQLHSVPGIYGGMMVFPFERAREVLTAYREVSQSAPDKLSVFAAVLTPPDVGAPVVALLVCYNGPAEEGEPLIQPLKALAPMADMTAPMRYEQIQTMLDDGFPFGLQNYWKSEFLSGLPDGALDAIIQGYASAPSTMSAIVLEQFGGAYRRIDPNATAFRHRGSDYNLLILGRWEQPTDANSNIAWARDVWSAIQPFAADAVYVNYLEPGQEGADRVRQAYGPGYDRLVALKRQYDPTNFFHHNQNIAPT